MRALGSLWATLASVCGRYSLTNPADIPERFNLTGLHEAGIEPRFNAAPTQELPVIIGTPEGPALQLMRWGFEPFWMRNQVKRRPQINARAETLLESPMFRDAAISHRCLIPADGFYEWTSPPGSRTSQPLHIRLRGGGLFAFAGIYAERRDGPATYAIVTTKPNELVASVHNRMPVILDPDDEASWLGNACTDPLAVLGCLRRYPPQEMEAYPVGPLVSSAWNEGPELIEPVSISQPRLWSM